MKTNNEDSPKIQFKPPALPVSYERITKPPTWVDVRPIVPDAVATVTDALASERRRPLPKRRHVDLLLIDEAGAAEARRRPAGDGHAGRAPGSIVSMGRPGPNGGESNLAPRPPLLQILANWTGSVRDHHAPNNTGASDDVQILMSALNYVLDDRQVMVVTDSLASYLDRRPRSFQTKVFPLPHVNGVICGTTDTTVPHVPADERDIMAALLRQLRQRRTTRVLERGNAER